MKVQESNNKKFKDMEKKKTLEFGKKYRVGNFFVFKFCKVLRKTEVAELRKQMGFPEVEQRMLQRAKLPYMKVEAISGIWAMEFCCNTTMYRFLDQMIRRAVDADNEGVKLESNSVADFAHMFNLMFMDTTIIGDSIYHQDRSNAMKAFVERQKALEISKEEDDKILDDLKADEEAKATIIDMANQIKEGGDDEGK